MSKRLHKLINALSPNEKGYIKKYGFGQQLTKSNSYELLFKIYDQLEEYDDVEIKKKWLAKKQKINLNQAKLYLEDLIVKNINAYSNYNEVLQKIDGALMKANIYFKKGLAEESLKILEKIEPYALNSFQFAKIHLVLYNHFRCFVATKDPNLFKKVKVILDKLRAVVMMQHNFYDSTEYYYKVLDIGLKNGWSKEWSEDVEAFQALIDEGEKVCAEGQSPNGKILANSMLFHLNSNKGDIVEAKKKALLTRKILNDNPVLKTRALGNYLSVSNYLIRANMLSQDFDKLNEIEKDLKTISPKDPNGVASKQNSLHLIFFIRSYNCLISKSEVLKMLLKNELQFQQFGKNISPMGQMQSLYQFIILYFLLDDFEKCTERCYDFVNNHPKHLRQDLLVGVSIINLVAHYELKNYDVLPYYLKQTYCFIKSMDQKNEFYNWFLRMLKQLNKTPINAFNRTKLEQFADDYEAFAKNKECPIEYFEPGVWLSSKSKNKNYHSLLIEHLKVKWI